MQNQAPLSRTAVRTLPAQQEPLLRQPCRNMAVERLVRGIERVSEGLVGLKSKLPVFTGVFLLLVLQNNKSVSFIFIFLASVYIHTENSCILLINQMKRISSCMLRTVWNLCVVLVLPCQRGHWSRASC